MITLRPPVEHELAAVSAMCLRSKAHWGYDAAFMAACVAELTMSTADLMRDAVVIAVADQTIAGVAQVSIDGTDGALEKLFVDPAHMGRGVGRRLFDWALRTAAQRGARGLIVESDPAAAAFYQRMGCIRAGSAPSAVIPGRHLPRLVCRVPG
ncbi:MAG: GNAT family N-acetyltransferase [Pseudomonadota bacterium]